MPTSASQPRLQIKSANVDDVPTFSDNGVDLSEQLTFRRPRRCIGARPKIIYRPPPLPSLTAFGDPDEQGMASEAGSSSSSSNLFPLAAMPDEQELRREPAGEHRARPLGTTSVRRGILKRKHSRTGIFFRSNNSRAGLRVTFAVESRLSATHTDAVSSPRHPSSTVGVQETVTVSAKQEEKAYDSSKTTTGDGVQSLFTVSVGTVKADPVQHCPKREPATENEPSLFFPSAETNHQTDLLAPIKHVDFNTFIDSASSAGQLTSQEAFSHVVECAGKLLSLIDVPPSHQLRRYRRFAHHLLTVTSTSRISAGSLNSETRAALRLLRDILKNMLELTAITKLPASEVRAEECKSAQARCKRRLQSVTNVASDMLSMLRVRLPAESPSIPKVKMEEES